jgi:hypothetical protein
MEFVRSMRALVATALLAGGVTVVGSAPAVLHVEHTP